MHPRTAAPRLRSTAAPRLRVRHLDERRYIDVWCDLDVGRRSMCVVTWPGGMNGSAGVAWMSDATLTHHAGLTR